MVRNSLADGVDEPHSMRNVSRLLSSITLSVLKCLPSNSVSRMNPMHSHVDICGDAMWLSLSGDEPFSGASLKVELHVAIHPVHFLVLPGLAILTHAREAFNKSPAWTLSDDYDQSVEH